MTTVAVALGLNNSENCSIVVVMRWPEYVCRKNPEQGRAQIVIKICPHAAAVRKLFIRLGTFSIVKYLMAKSTPLSLKAEQASENMLRLQLQFRK